MILFTSGIENELLNDDIRLEHDVDELFHKTMKEIDELSNGIDYLLDIINQALESEED